MQGRQEGGGEGWEQMESLVEDAGRAGAVTYAALPTQCKGAARWEGKVGGRPCPHIQVHTALHTRVACLPAAGLLPPRHQARELHGTALEPAAQGEATEAGPGWGALNQQLKVRPPRQGRGGERSSQQVKVRQGDGMGGSMEAPSISLSPCPLPALSLPSPCPLPALSLPSPCPLPCHQLFFLQLIAFGLSQHLNSA